MATPENSTATRDALRCGRVTLIDGGTGSELRRRGAALDAVTWSGSANLSHAALLTDIHADYLRAGARVVTANTFGTSRFVLEAAGLADRFAEINTAAIDAARRARDSTGIDATIAASLSCLPPGFDARAYPDAAREEAAYVELAALFAEHGVELVVLEMMQDRDHAARACRAARGSGLPFWLGVSVKVRPDGSLTAFDDPRRELDEYIDALIEHSPAAINVMHSPVEAVPRALEAISRRWTGRIGAYAEIAYAEDPERRARAALSASDYAREARGWLAAGATILGGCCGTTPAHIRELSHLLL